jgi:hypothetical protein
MHITYNKAVRTHLGGIYTQAIYMYLDMYSIAKFNGGTRGCTWISVMIIVEPRFELFMPDDLLRNVRKNMIITFADRPVRL